ncbi:hypothetical protein QTP86_008469 [Hemibagrus guttatus]|nr:hypothetical protein QTP86_008469 [Hemibagrus guttatus]
MTSTAEPQSRMTSTAEPQDQATSTAEQQLRATSTAEHSHRATSTDERRLRGDDVRLAGVWNSPRGGRVGSRGCRNSPPLATAGKMGKRKDLSEFDKGHIVMARPLDQSISKTAALVECSQSKEGTVVKR